MLNKQHDNLISFFDEPIYVGKGTSVGKKVGTQIVRGRWIKMKKERERKIHRHGERISRSVSYRSTTVIFAS